MKAVVGVVLVVAAVLAAAPAHAEPVDPVVDSWAPTCVVLDQNLGRWVDPNVSTLAGVSKGIAERYNLSWQAGADVLVVQVRTYCPQHWPAVQFLSTLLRDRLR